ncbi:MAG TPA: hypothetical protein VJP45_10480 [Candidatus Limnocylindria bacterium]|nr:hypothetical protein [Candidatus Limnocylindria bacterium]
MTLDRTKPPPGAEMDHRYTTDGDEYVVRMGTFAFSPDPAECLRLAWEAYDRITLPARVALLRELAAELQEGGRLEDIATRASGVWEAVERLHDELTARADALGTATPEPP